ncbi:MAG: hypothetical protein NT001_06530 [Candidatus Woesearchaeota archaeon]|nr:hypothetical protein [Candidatus Woesearchaeota archaeon]
MSSNLKTSSKAAILMLLSIIFVLAMLPQACPNPDLAISIEIPAQFKEVSAGDFILFTVNTYLYRSSGRKDVYLSYNVKDEEGQTIATKTVTVAIDTHLSDIGRIEIPKETPPGKYTLEVEAVLSEGPEEEQRIASEEFSVIKVQSETDNTYKKYVVYLIIFISILVILVMYLLYKLIKIEEKKIAYGRKNRDDRD